MTRMNHLSLFTGAGCGELGAILNGWHTVGYVEWDDYCQRVLAQRIRDGILPEAPIFCDIRAFISEGYAEAYQGMVDVISGGFPCQDISCAGGGKGIEEGERSGLWRDMARVVGIIRPRYVLVENSPDITFRGLGIVLRDLAELGFDALWGRVSAKYCGAPHLRNRFWLVAYPSGERSEGLRLLAENITNMGNHYKFNNEDSWISAWIKGETRGELQINEANSESILCRRDDGLAEGMDRLRAIGNGQVPAVVKAVWRLLNNQ
jgi:DNA (cytosine-5)-methyltransferase 1